MIWSSIPETSTFSSRPRRTALEVSTLSSLVIAWKMHTFNSKKTFQNSTLQDRTVFMTLAGIDKLGIDFRRMLLLEHETASLIVSPEEAMSLFLLPKLAFMTLVRRALTASSSAEDASLVQAIGVVLSFDSYTLTFGNESNFKFFLLLAMSVLQSMPLRSLLPIRESSCSTFLPIGTDDKFESLTASSLSEFCSGCFLACALKIAEPIVRHKSKLF